MYFIKTAVSPVQPRRIGPASNKHCPKSLPKTWKSELNALSNIRAGKNTSSSRWGSNSDHFFIAVPNLPSPWIRPKLQKRKTEAIILVNGAGSKETQRQIKIDLTLLYRCGFGVRGRTSPLIWDVLIFINILNPIFGIWLKEFVILDRRIGFSVENCVYSRLEMPVPGAVNAKTDKIRTLSYTHLTLPTKA